MFVLSMKTQGNTNIDGNIILEMEIIEKQIWAAFVKKPLWQKSPCHPQRSYISLIQA